VQTAEHKYDSGEEQRGNEAAFRGGLGAALHFTGGVVRARAIDTAQSRGSDYRSVRPRRLSAPKNVNSRTTAGTAASSLGGPERMGRMAHPRAQQGMAENGRQGHRVNAPEVANGPRLR